VGEVKLDRDDLTNRKRKGHIQMNGNEYNDAYPTKEEFKLDIIQHIAKTHDLELTWELVGALRSAYAEARLKINGDRK